jgi:hypothetical protein
MSRIIYILLLLSIFGCAQQANETSASNEEKNNTTEAAAELEAIDETTTINEMTPLEYIILGKLQEIYDLQKIVSDTSINSEIRTEAKYSLSNLITETETLEYIKNGNVSNVKLTNDSNHITFKLDNQLKEANVKVDKETVVIEGESIDNIEITVEEIR